MTRDYVIAGTDPGDDLLTDVQLEGIAPFKRATYRKWRLSWPHGARKGPRPVRVEGRVFYRRADVDAWLSGASVAEPSDGL